VKWIILSRIVKHLLLTLCAKFDENLFASSKVIAKIVGSLFRVNRVIQGDVVTHVLQKVAGSEYVI